MTSRTTTTLLRTSAFAALILAAPAMAQGQPVTGGEVSEIVVTARRVEERLQDVPISITVYNQEQVANRNITNASDLATYTPSLSANSRGGTERASFVIRGFTQEAGTSPSVAAYFADVVAPRGGSGAVASGNGAGPGQFFDLQNVQVLKGPQGTLFGRNTTGGAILLVPQKPTDRLEGYVEGSFGNHDMWRVQAVLNAPLNDAVRVRLGFDRQYREGYLRNRSGVGPDDFNDVDYIALRGSVTVDLTPDIETYTIGYYNRSNTNGFGMRVIDCQRNPLLRGAGGALLGDAACDQVDRQNARGDGYYDIDLNLADARQRITQWQAINTTTWRVSNGLTVRNIISYGEFRDNFVGTQLGDNFRVPSVLNVLTNAGRPNVTNTPRPTGALAGTPYAFVLSSPALGTDQGRQSTFTEELQFQGVAFDDRMEWQAGGYVEISSPLGFSGTMTPNSANCIDLQNLVCSDVLAPLAGRVVGSVGHRVQKNRFRNLAAYAQGSYTLTDQLTLTAGLRYTSDRNKLTQRQLTYRFTAPPAPPALIPAASFCTNAIAFTPTRFTNSLADCTVTTVEKSSRPTWLLSLEYKPTEDILLYGKYARGYRQGGVNPQANSRATFDPEKVDSYEIGAKTSFDGFIRGSINLAAFYNDFADQQLAVSVTARQTAAQLGSLIVNAGKSRIQGFEADLNLRLFEGFLVSGGYTYLDAKLVDFTPPDATNDPLILAYLPTIQEGKQLPLSPKHKLSVTGSYTLPLDEQVGQITLSATYTHTSSSVSTYASPTAVVPPIDLLNLNLNWRSVGGRPIDLALFATNVLQVKYPTFYSGGLPVVAFETQGVAEPRMVGVRVRAHFGH